MGKVTHGKAHTRLYRTYCHMVGRCYCSTDAAYKDYGGRGITICDDWKNDFMNFYNWSMQNGYLDCLTIDRVDNERGYEPSNCRWVGIKEQSNNRRSNVNVELNGITKNMSQWCKEFGLNYKVIMDRVYRGWCVEKALLTPVRRNKMGG